MVRNLPERTSLGRACHRSLGARDGGRTARGGSSRGTGYGVELPLALSARRPRSAGKVSARTVSTRGSFRRLSFLISIAYCLSARSAYADGAKILFVSREETSFSARVRAELASMGFELVE